MGGQGVRKCPVKIALQDTKFRLIRNKITAII